MGDTFKHFLSEKRKRKKKGKKKNSRKYAVGGGPAVGQGGMGGEVSFGDGGAGGGGGESFIPTDGNLLRELAQSPYAMTSRVLAHTQAGSSGTEQQEDTRPKPRYCDRCGKRLRKRDRWCSICGEKAPDLRAGTEQQERQVDLDAEGQDQDDQNQQPDQQDDQFGDDQQAPSPDELDPEEPQDPDKQGIIRTVDDAHLVYKRQTPDGDYEELWIYNIDRDLKNELEIRRNILAGTDIPQGKTKSDDGSQHYNLVTLGNAQLLHIQGLQN